MKPISKYVVVSSAQRDFFCDDDSTPDMVCLLGCLVSAWYVNSALSYDTFETTDID